MVWLASSSQTAFIYANSPNPPTRAHTTGKEAFRICSGESTPSNRLETEKLCTNCLAKF